MAFTLIAPKVGAAFKRNQSSKELEIQGVLGERIFGISWLTISLSGELGEGDHSLLLDIAFFFFEPHLCCSGIASRSVLRHLFWQDTDVPI